MQQVFKLAAVAALCASAIAAQAGVSIDANFENNTDFHKKDATHDSVSNGGRVEVNVNAAIAKNGDNFVNARGTVGLTENGDTYVDDAWVQAGTGTFDVKVGRFEATTLFPWGRDVAPNITNDGGPNVGYTGNTLRGRMKDGRLHAAVNAKLGGGLGFELGLVTQKQSASGNYGVRPVLTYAAGPLSLAAGIEAIKPDGGGTSSTGAALTVGYALNSTTSMNVSVANNSKLKTSGLGLIANIGDIGLGFVQGKDNIANTKSTTFYGSYSFPLFGVKGATITPAFGVTKVTGASSDNAFRVRINYAF